MKHKTAELEGDALDYAVQWAMRGEQPLVSVAVWASENDDGFHPRENWAQGGPLITQKRINIRNDGAGINAAVYQARQRVFWHRGPTELIAAMRALVASELGEEVELP